mgnify:CR=1 FL=1
MAASAGPEIERLISLLAKLPGLGPRSARRAALQLIKKRDTLLGPLAEAMRVAAERIVVVHHGLAVGGELDIALDREIA